MLKCLRYTQLPAEMILLYLRVNSFMTCKNLTSITKWVEDWIGCFCNHIFLITMSGNFE